ncbi:hypothetical protein [Granulosicoccus antarcticus]|uniref:Uncharacterized protein n=1 Tax=Granulosicoccus antarcticus IMCC3135 TaxID=1192854 RepID=A0A2Z2NMJ7_9GAMM|nr:hypothetical protein [Granulosicoccus antarcticus]ASJ72433.1 hypothetical protein IMCC3135_11715 [Granulosicoccus antarcticus IMCC3135]
MWFITLIVLALAAALIIKAVKAQSERKLADEAQLSQTSGLQGQLNRDTSSQTKTPDQTSADNNSGGDKTVPTEAGSEKTPEQTAQSTVSADAQQAESREIREMIKILNLTEADASRLGINAEQFSALRSETSTTTSALPTAKVQTDVADRLRRMLA